MADTLTKLRTLHGQAQRHFSPAYLRSPRPEVRIDQLVIETGYTPDKLLEDAMAGYVAELAETREMLNSRYDELKSGRVKPIDGEEFFENLRRREDELLKKHPPQ